MTMKSNIPLTKKYLPKKINDVIGQDNALKEIVAFIANFKKEKKNAALLHGSIGVGKTSSVYAVANELGLEILEINASDFRNAEQIELRVGNAIKQKSLFSSGKIILVDDVDGLSGREDRGGIQAIIKLMVDSNYPLILTVTSIYEDNLRPLVKKCKLIEFSKLDYNSIYAVLKKVCDAEKIKYTESVLKELAYSSAGDARAVLNDLQSILYLGNEITGEKVKELSERNRKDTIINALNRIFKTTDLGIALHAFDNIDEDIDEKILWIDENLAREYTNPKDLARAYDMLSRADVFKSRVRRIQHYRFLAYADALLSGGIASSKEKKYANYVEYKPTGRLLKIWMANQKLARKKSIASKIAVKTHQSIKEMMMKTMPFVPFIFRDKRIRVSMINEFKLDEDEIEYLDKRLIREF